MVRLGSSRSFGLGRVLPLSTLSDLWADGHTFKKTWAKAIDKMKNENTLSVGLDLKVMHFPLGLSKRVYSLIDVFRG